MSRAVSVNGLEKMMWMNIFDLMMSAVVYGEVIASREVNFVESAHLFLPRHDRPKVSANNSQWEGTMAAKVGLSSIYLVVW